MAAPAGCSCRGLFTVACGVLSRCVRATAGNKMTTEAHARTSTTMLLMPGADVAPDVREDAVLAPAPELAQPTIMHGGHVMVFNDVPVHKAAELVRVATGHCEQGILHGMTDVPVAVRKGSLQRFMEKR